MCKIIGPLLLLLPTIAFAQVRELRLDREITIGDLDDERYALTRISDLEVSEDGTIYVAQPQEQRIRVFTRSGEFDRYIGRPGEGPGEFRDIGSLGWLRGSLYVIDQRLWRISLFSPEGTLGATFQMRSLDVAGSYVPAPPSRLLPDGTGIVRPRVSVQVMGQGQVQEVPILRIDRDGLTIDTLLWERWRGTGGAVASNALAMMVPQPLASHDLWAINPTSGAIVVVTRKPPVSGNADHFEVSKRSIRGDTVFRRRFRYQPKRVTAADADSIMDAAEARLLNLLGPRGRAALQANGINMVEALRPALALPNYQPAVSELLVGPDGYIWLRREEIRTTPPKWIVLNPDGTIRAEVITPPSVRLLRVNASTVWGVETDDFGVEYIGRYHMEEW